VEAVFQLLRLGRQQSGWLDRVGTLISKAAESGGGKSATQALGFLDFRHKRVGIERGQFPQFCIGLLDAVLDLKPIEGYL